MKPTLVRALGGLKPLEHPAHELCDLAVDYVVLARESLLERWEAVTIERHEALRFPDRGSFAVEAWQKRDADKAASLFAPTYKVAVMYDEGVFRAEFIMVWVTGEDVIGRVQHGPAKDEPEAIGNAALVAGSAVGWLLLPPERLQELQKDAAEARDP